MLNTCRNRFCLPYISCGVSFVCANQKHLKQLNTYAYLLKPLILNSRQLGYHDWRIFVRKHNIDTPNYFEIEDPDETTATSLIFNLQGKKHRKSVLIRLPVFPLSRFEEFRHYDVITCSDKLRPIGFSKCVLEHSSVFFLAQPEKIIENFKHIEQKYCNQRDIIEQTSSLLNLTDEKQHLFSTLFPIETKTFTHTYPSDYPQYFHPEASPRTGDIVISGGVSDSPESELELCRAVGNSGKVYAFEPDPAGARAASEFFASQADIKNIEIVPLGLWRKKETVTFVSGLGGSSYVKEGSEHCRSAEKHRLITQKSGAAPNSVNEITINMTTIDDFVQERGLSRLDFIKLDIEGSELAALEGARQSFLRFAPRFAICIYHKPEDIWTIPQFIKDLEKDGLKYDLFFGTHSFDRTREFILYGSAKK